METVVYILGAGFSAPIGLPVMGNFLSKSKDLLERAPARYEHFRSVYEHFGRFASIKHVYTSNQLNIEEVLSISRMTAETGGKDDLAEVTEFIADVITHYTPPPMKVHSRSCEVRNWYDLVFGDRELKALLSIVLMMLGVRVEKDGILSAEPIQRDVRYGVISFNYDTVVEDLVAFLGSSTFRTEEWGTSSDPESWERPDCRALPLAKVHGCVRRKEFVPPTWNKSISKEIRPSWELARRMLVDANHIRVLGYSMPTTDSYVAYLLKSAAADCLNLKSLDVITMDPDGDARERYLGFAPNARFRDAKIEDYGDVMFRWRDWSEGDQSVEFRKMEEAHERFMRNPKLA